MRRHLPFLLAVADTAVVAAYAIGINPIIVQLTMLALKIFLIPFLLRPDSIIQSRGPELFVIFVVALVSLAFSSFASTNAFMQVLGFFAHLALTLLLLPREISIYLKWVAQFIAASAVLYLVMAATGQVSDHWGRLNYFNGEHPNLGTEIAAAGAIAGAISLRFRRFLLVATPLFASAVVMQGRAAILAIVFAIILRCLHELYLAAKSERAQLWIMAAGPLGIGLVAFSFPLIMDAMMLRDQHRGVGTGIAGRSDQWGMAWDAFLNRPLTGQGPGWIAATHDLGAHNFFLYGLAEMGLLALVIYVLLAVMAVRSFRWHGWKIITISPILVLFMMNDRFMNLNPYPFIIWVMFFSLSTAPRVAAAVGRPSQLRTRDRINRWGAGADARAARG